MKWLTRARPKVNRVACSWLIKRFVDPDAEIIFAPTEQILAVGERGQATRVHVPDFERGGRGGERGFDALLRRYDLATQDPALAHLARIIRGADSPERDLTPESRGLRAIMEGFVAAFPDDHEVLAAAMPVYEA